MRPLCFAFTVAALCVAPPHLLAQTATGTSAQPDEARVKLALRLLELTDMRKQMESSMNTMANAQVAMVTETLRKAGVPEEEIRKREAQQRELPALVLKELNLETIARDAALIQAEIFTEDELRGMIAFYESAAGRAWVSRAPDIMTRMMALMQKRMVEAGPKIMELIKKRTP
jgi:hypothetical protein